jgi:ketosteroid isomerase-like protein
MSRLTDLTTNYLTAIAAKDLDTVTGFFTDDVALLGPGGPANGKTAVRTAIGNVVNNAETITFTTIELYEKDPTILAETIAESDGKTIYNVHAITFTDEKISDIKLYTL